MTFLRRYWLYILVATLPFERIPALNVTLYGHSTTLRLSYFVALIGFVIFFRELLKLLKWRLSSPQSWLLLYLFIALLSVLTAASRSRGAIALIATLITVGAGLTVSQVVRAEYMARVYKVLYWVTIGVCAFGLYQFIGDGMGLSPSFTGLAANYTHHVFGFARIQSTALEPLFFGNFLLIPLLLTVVQLLRGKEIRKLTPFLVLLSLTITLTLSRGTFYAGIAAIIGLAVLYVRPNTLKYGGVVIGSIGIGIGIGLAMIALITTYGAYHTPTALKKFDAHSTTITVSSTSADSDRETNRKFATTAFKSRPLLGWGLGNFGTYVQQTHPNFYGPGTGGVVVNDEYLEVLAETGILGALALLGFGVTLLWAVWKKLAIATSDERMWLLGLAAIAGAFAIQYYSFSTLYVMHIWVALGLLMGLSLYTKKPAKQS